MANSRNGKLVKLAMCAVFALVIGTYFPKIASAADANTAPEASPSAQPTAVTASTKKEDSSYDVLKESDEFGSHCHTSKKAQYEKVTCSHPHAACAESEKVIETLELMSHLYSEGKLDEFSKYLDEDITTFDEKNNKLITGKKAVVEDVKTRWNQAHDSGHPIVSFAINHPYAQVTGDQAVVTFEAVKRIGGDHPETLVSRCTDIFVKKDGEWKKMHYRRCWKKGKSTCGT